MIPNDMLDIHSQINNYVVTLKALGKQDPDHPAGNWRLDKTTVKKINDAAEFLTKNIGRIHDAERDLPLLGNLEAAIEQLQEERLPGEGTDALENLKKKTQMCIKNCKPFDVFLPDPMGIIATFLPRSDIRTLELLPKVDNSKEATQLNVDAQLIAAIKFDPRQEIPQQMRLYVDEFVEDYHASPDDPNRDAKMVEKARHFLKHASLNQQEKFFQDFLKLDWRTNNLPPKYEICLRVILRELPYMEGLERLNLKKLSLLSGEFLKEFFEKIADGPVLKTVKQLALQNVDEATSIAIITNPHLVSNLEELDVTSIKMSDPVCSSLSRMSNLKTLKWDSTLEENEWENIVNNLKLVNLEEFHFQCLDLNKLETTKNLETLLTDGQMPNLKHLSIHNTSLNRDMMALLLARIRFPKLEALEFWDCTFSPEDFKTFVENPLLKTMKSLTFNCLATKFLPFLLESPHLHPNFTLNLMNVKEDLQEMRQLNPRVTINVIGTSEY